MYKLNIEFFKDVEPTKSKYNVTGRFIYFVLQKKEKGLEYWPRLFKQKGKLHYIHTDFDKWVDEDEQEEVENKVEGADAMNGLDLSQLEGLSKMSAEAQAANLSINSNAEDDESSSDSEDEEAAAKTPAIAATTETKA